MLCGLIAGLAAMAGQVPAGEKEGLHLRFSLAKPDDDKPVEITVSGRITDAKTSQPIAGALVRGFVVIWRHRGPELLQKCPYQETRSDRQGRYQLRFVTPLTVSGPMKGQDGLCVYAGAPGYETLPLWVRPSLAPGKTDFAEVNLALRAGRLVKGTVVDEQGKPLAGAVVTVQSGLSGGWAFFGALGKATTNGKGQFEIWCCTDRREVIGSDPWLQVLKRGYGIGFFWDLFKKDSMGTLIVPKGGTIVGRVVDKQGKDVAGCEVLVRDVLGDELDRTTTGKDGRYELKGVLGEPTAVQFFTTKNRQRPEPILTSVTVYARREAGMNLRDVPQYQIRAKDGRTVAGPDLVVGAEAGVSGGLVASKTVRVLQGLMIRLDYSWDNMVEADADGKFRFACVRPGKHSLTAYLPNNLRGDRGIGRTQINVEPGKPVENVRIELEALAEARVQFLDAKANPLEGITAGATWTKEGTGFWTEGTTSDKDGWAVLHLYPGQLQYVRGFDPSGALVAEGYEQVKPQAGEVLENLRIVMVPTAGLRGRLVTESKQPVADRRLLCRLDYADGARKGQTLATDSSGRFEMTGLVPGIVKLVIETDPPELSGSAASPLEIKPGEQKDLGDVALKEVKLYKVSGRLVGSPTFADLGGFKIRLGLRQWEPMLPADAQGRFVIPKLRPGRHRLTAYLPFNLRTDRGVGHVDVNVTDKDVEDVQLPLETLATVHVRIVDEAGKPLEGISAAAWWTENHTGVFTEGTKSDKQGRATLYLYPDQLQYVGAHDWAGKYRLQSHKEMNLKQGQVVKDHTVVMLPAPE
ncbi:MAG: hypothetical protein AMJ81_08290 [Phycisphaerae bacterium SM23_33]|nr:MAG: hypothetical protein AMJ81_08290 [Phycisphaerae bacterium SM23_33]